jgi:hypothetical protein
LNELNKTKHKTPKRADAPVPIQNIGVPHATNTILFEKPKPKKTKINPKHNAENKQSNVNKVFDFFECDLSKDVFCFAI